MDRYYIYPDTQFRELIVRLTKADEAAHPELVRWLKDNHPDDWRIPYIEKEKSNNGKYRFQYLNRVLTLFGIHCCHCDWPNQLPCTPDCKRCAGTGWMHHVTLPPGCGFTIGWAPGIFNLNDNAVQLAADDAKSVFKQIFPQFKVD